MEIDAASKSEREITSQDRAQMSERLTGIVADATRGSLDEKGNPTGNPELANIFERDAFGNIKISDNISAQLGEFERQLTEINKNESVKKLGEASQALAGSLEEFGGRVASGGTLWEKASVAWASYVDLFTNPTNKDGSFNFVGRATDSLSSTVRLINLAKQEGVDLAKMSPEDREKYIKQKGILDYRLNEREASTHDVGIVTNLTGGIGEAADAFRKVTLASRETRENYYKEQLKDRYKDPKELAEVARKARMAEEQVKRDEAVQAVVRGAVGEDSKNRPEDIQKAKEIADYWIRVPEEAVQRVNEGGDLAQTEAKRNARTRTFRAKTSELEPTRIDYELNKSLTTNSRNMKVLGAYDSNFLQNTLAAYNLALTDIENTTTKAAGPREEAAMKQQAVDLADLRTKKAAQEKLFLESDVIPKKITSKEKAEFLTKEKEDDLSTLEGRIVQSRKLGEATAKEIEGRKTHSQAIQEENDERRKLNLEIAGTREVLRSLVLFDGIIRSSVKNTTAGMLSKGIVVGEAELQSTTDIDYIDKQIARAKEIQATKGYADTAKGRNEIKALQDQRADAVKAINKTRKDNNPGNVLVKDMGQQAFGAFTGLLTDQVFESGFAAVLGEAGGGKPGFNPLANLLGGDKYYENKSLDYLAKIAFNTDPETPGKLAATKAAAEIQKRLENEAGGLTPTGLMGGIGELSPLDPKRAKLLGYAGSAAGAGLTATASLAETQKLNQQIFDYEAMVANYGEDPKLPFGETPKGSDMIKGKNGKEMPYWDYLTAKKASESAQSAQTSKAATQRMAAVKKASGRNIGKKETYQDTMSSLSSSISEIAFSTLGNLDMASIDEEMVNQLSLENAISSAQEEQKTELLSKSGSGLPMSMTDKLIMSDSGMLNQTKTAKPGTGFSDKLNKSKMLGYGMAAVSGGAMGNQITASQNKTGLGGTIGGAVGAAAGMWAGTQMGASMGPVGMAVGALAGGLLGALFDKPNEPELKKLPEIEEEQLVELKTMNKNLNTINDTMENLINAPSNFTLPIPKGILDNSITAQSAIATPLQAEGLINKSGPAYLHAGEQVTKGGSRSGGYNNVTNTITINGADKDPKQIAEEVMTQLNSSMFMQAQRTGGYRRRF